MVPLCQFINLFFCNYRAPFEERSSDSIFVVDTTADNDKPKPKDSNRKKKIKEIGELRCYTILTPNSAVTDPLKKR